MNWTDTINWRAAVSSQKWKIMSCKMKIEQLKEAVAGGNEEVKSGESVWRVFCFLVSVSGSPRSLCFEWKMWTQWQFFILCVFVGLFISLFLLSFLPVLHVPSLLLLLQIRTSSYGLRRRVSGCSVGPDATRRNGIKSSVTTAVWGNCWSDAAGSCRADWVSWQLWDENTSWSSPPTSSPHRRRSRAAGETTHTPARATSQAVCVTECEANRVNGKMRLDTNSHEL